MAKQDQDQEKQPQCPGKIRIPYNAMFLIINAILLVATSFWFVTVTSLQFGSYDCSSFVSTPGILISFALLSMSVVGFYASYYKSDALFRVYFFLFFLWVLALVSVSMCLGLLNRQTNPRVFPGTRIKEYALHNYSGWLRKLILKEEDWYRVKRCLVSDNVCNDLSSAKNMSVAEFYNMDLNPLKSGCCKPPLSCGFGFIRPTFWNTTSNSNITDADCMRWTNNMETVCFDCDSCKAGFIANIKRTTQSVGAMILQIASTFAVGYIGWSSWILAIQETHNSDIKIRAKLNL